MMVTEEIAADLHVTVNTVKTHLKSVQRKLTVNRRNDAPYAARVNSGCCAPRVVSVARR
jgi:LuxR family transcriptional regulator, maltose regulon positive regulatory protein